MLSRENQTLYVCVNISTQLGLCACMCMINISFNADDYSERLHFHFSFKVDTILDGRICRKGREMATIFSANEHL